MLQWFDVASRDHRRQNVSLADEDSDCLRRNRTGADSLASRPPSTQDPLTFERSGNRGSIQPGEMWTDGGSIPRTFWVFKHYSPWGYGPAFIIHDWLFHMQDCELPGYDKYTIEVAATVMSEVMKTLMEEPAFNFGSKNSLYFMYKAVQSPAAVQAWEDKECERTLQIPKDEPDKTFLISFD